MLGAQIAKLNLEMQNYTKNKYKIINYFFSNIGYDIFHVMPWKLNLKLNLYAKGKTKVLLKGGLDQLFGGVNNRAKIFFYRVKRTM